MCTTRRARIHDRQSVGRSHTRQSPTAAAEAAGVPSRRSQRAGAAAANAAMDVARERERAPMPTDAWILVYRRTFTVASGPVSILAFVFRALLRDV